MTESSEEKAGLKQLKLDKCHTEGLVLVSWVKSEGTWHTVTAGADSKVVTRHPRNHQEVKSAEGKAAVHCIAVSPDGKYVVGVDDQYVRAWRLPDLSRVSMAIGRLMGTARCCCWTNDSTAVAAAGDDREIQIITVKDSKVRQRLKNECFTRGLALDPEGQYLAAVTADGTVTVWDIKQEPAAKQEFRKRLGPKIDHDDDVALQGLAWHPDGGTLLAISGQDNDVVLLERLSWSPVSYLTGGHDGSIGVIAFSPNGVYAATAGADNKVVVWSVDSAMQVSARQLSCSATSLSWHPQNNALLVGGSDGGVALWTAPVPECNAAGHKLPSPWLPVDDLLEQADRAAEAISKAAAGGMDDADLEDELDDDDAMQQVVRRRGPPAEEDTVTVSGDGLTGPDMLDRLDAIAETAAGLRGRVPGSSRFAAGHNAPRPKPPQAPIHPGSTPASSNSNARFLAYNQLGCVVSRAVDDHHTIEVSFHDTSRHRLRVPLLTDYYNFTAASLSSKGVAYISASAGAEQPSMLVWRGFESWASGSDWTAAMPQGEDALVVAAGTSVVAVATSAQLLRLYSIGGRQLAVLSIPGQAVALVTTDPGHANDGGVLELFTRHYLAVVWANSGPRPFCGTQNLSYLVLDITHQAQISSGVVALSAGASLSWLAFTKEGILAALDSAGVLRLRSQSWGGSWLPVLDTSTVKTLAGAEVYWPTWLDTNKLMAVITSNKTPYPQVCPRPLITSISLRVCTAPTEAAPADAEEAGLRMELQGAHIRALQSHALLDGNHTEVEEILSMHRVDADKSALRLFTAYLKANKQTRALEMAVGLHQVKSLEGALKIANHFHMPQLAERITAVLEQRIAADLEQQQNEIHQVDACAIDMVQEGMQPHAPVEVENVAPIANNQAQLSTSHDKAMNHKRKIASLVDADPLPRPRTNPFARKKTD